MNNSKIEWTDRTWNPVTGCTKVSQGCKNCYAERIYERFNGPGAFKKVLTHPERLQQPLKWKKPSKIFVNSMSDLFHEDVPFEFIYQVHLVMIKATQHTFQVLTKRPQRMIEFYQHYEGILNGIPNVWLGVSVEDQATADERIPVLLDLAIKATVKFLSCEPLLSAIDFEQADFSWRGANGIDWIICGGESGPGARPMHPDWARSIRDQCEVAGVAFFFKQWGQFIPSYQAGERIDEPGRYKNSLGSCAVKFNHTFEDGINMVKVGNKAAGRLLDGNEHNAFPNLKTAAK